MPTILSPIALPIGQPGPSIQRKFSMSLYLSDGLTLAANRSGLWWAWWPSVANVRTDAPAASGSGATTNASGLFEVNAPNYLSTSNDQGYGLISDQDSTPDASEVAYSGTFDVI
jgi:hypothetical protein